MTSTFHNHRDWVIMTVAGWDRDNRLVPAGLLR
jgi:hypothetical protein